MACFRVDQKYTGDVVIDAPTQAPPPSHVLPENRNKLSESLPDHSLNLEPHVPERDCSALDSESSVSSIQTQSVCSTTASEASPDVITDAVPPPSVLSIDQAKSIRHWIEHAQNASPLSQCASEETYWQSNGGREDCSTFRIENIDVEEQGAMHKVPFYSAKLNDARFALRC